MPYSTLSHIAHKIRTPLTVIISTVNNFLDGAFGKISSDQKKRLEKLNLHTQTLESLTNTIFEILKAQPGAILDSIHEKLENSPQSVPATPLSIPSANAATIFIVDDEPDIRDVIQEGMTIKGFATQTFENGAEALGQALKRSPDLILMDVYLKDGNGMDFCREIKSKAGSFIPIILVTGQNDLREKIGEGEFVADDILMKPFLMEELFSRVNSMLRIKLLVDELNSLKKAA